MATETEIANFALGHIGATQTITNIDTDTSKEAKVCRRFYDNTLYEVLGEYDWPFARTIITLALIEEDPNDNWGYSYTYPANCVKFLEIQSGVRNEHDTSWVAYEIAHDNDLKVIYTDQEDAKGEYTKIITDGSLYPFDFVMALSWRLAFYIAPSLIIGDPFKLREFAGQAAQLWIQKAAARAFNESPREVVPKSRFVRSRSG